MDNIKDKDMDMNIDKATDNKVYFASDYMEGAHDSIMKRLAETNMVKSSGYGTDEFSESARDKIREACGCPDAEVHFLVGGTQTNATVIGALLKPYQGVIAATSGHISIHEAGAIEAGGHKVMTVPEKSGKITADDVEGIIFGYHDDVNCDHMVMPGMVYISQPTEYGTLYSLEELKAISTVCRQNEVPLYLDGARLAYALACPENDVSLKDIAELCDAFYIGGTKCGALFGEAVVFPKRNYIPHFFTIVKQNGALLAKGRILGIQFDTLFTDRLYMNIGESAIAAADRIREALSRLGYKLCFDSPTNQIFVMIENDRLAEMAEKAEFGVWEKIDDNYSIIRFATSWATDSGDVERLIKILEDLVA